MYKAKVCRREFVCVCVSSVLNNYIHLRAFMQMMNWFGGRARELFSEGTSQGKSEGVLDSLVLEDNDQMAIQN